MLGIRILIADHEGLVRRAMRIFVDAADGMEVVGEASDVTTVLRQSAALKPDVVVMDMHMPGFDDVETTRAVLEAAAADTRLLTLATLEPGLSARRIVPALRVGLSACLVKDIEPEDLIAAIRLVHEGGYTLSPQVTQDLVETIRSTPTKGTPDLLTADEELTQRELTIVRLLARGMSNGEIAQTMRLSESTVKTHLGHVMSKWGARDRVQVLIRAARATIVRFP